MKIILTGYPGSGKSTIAKLLATDYGLLHVSTGQLCRDEVQAQTSLGLRIQKLVQQGQYVDTKEWFPLVLKALDAFPKKGWVIEGAPRSAEQAALFKVHKQTTPTLFVHLDVSKAECTRRILSRSKTDQRADDTEPSLKRRFQLHDMHHYDLEMWFPGIYRKVDASVSLALVYKAVKKLVAHSD